MSRSRRPNKQRSFRRWSRNGYRCQCPLCVPMAEKLKPVVLHEAAAETVTGAERWYDWEGGFLECG